MATDAMGIHKSRGYFRPECPFCKCVRVWRLHPRGIIEKHLFRVFHLSPHQCMDCDQRFYARNTIATASESGLTL